MRPFFFKTLIRGLLAAYLVSGILILSLTAAQYWLALDESLTNAAVYILYLLSRCAGGTAAGKTAGSRRFFWGLLTGLCYILLLIFLSFLFQKNAPFHLHAFLLPAVCCLVGGTLGGILS